MKKASILFILVMFSITTSSYSQWAQLFSGNTAELRSVFFNNSQTGYVAGSDGIMIKTTNGGATWVLINSGTTDTLRSVFFTSDSIGYAVGAKGTVIKTINAGYNWNFQTTGTLNLLRSVHFPTQDTGYIAGGNGTILKTTDGGINWVSQVSGTIQDLISIRFVNSDTGYAVSSLPTFFNGLILKTTNGGSNWDTVHVNAHGFLGVFPVSSDIVYAAGDSGTIVKTIDGGTTWNSLVTGNNNRLRTLFFLNSDTGYAAGELGTMLFTGDGGSSWTDQTSQTSGLLGLYFPMTDTGYTVGIAGNILRYSKPCALPGQPTQILGGTTVCENDSITYQVIPVPNATSYTWSGPPGSFVSSGQGDTLATIIFGSASGNVSVVGNNQCGGGIPLMLLINVNLLPAIPVISLNGQLLQSTFANNYQWYLNGNLLTGADSISLIPALNGIYTVVITNTFGCTAASAPFSVINAGTIEMDNPVALFYPLPFNDYLSVSWNSNLVSSSNKTISIYDLLGHLCCSINVLQNSATLIKTENLTPAMYFYHVMIDDKVVWRGTLIKQ